jgi:hypothetical protein
MAVAGNSLDGVRGQLLEFLVIDDEKRGGTRKKFDASCRREVVSRLAFNIVRFDESLNTLENFIFVL